MQTAVRHECILRNGGEFETGLVHLRMGSSHLHFRARVSHIAYCIASHIALRATYRPL